MASPTFAPSDSPQSGQYWDARARRDLDDLVSDLMRVRAEMHRLQAEEATILSRAETLASRIAAEGAHADHGEFAHRAIAAELGTAVRESDRAMTAKIDRASTLAQRYPGVLSELGSGSISLAHAHTIAEAGTIIQRDEARAEYVYAALDIAQREVVGRARPIIKELAERFAERTLDDRHTEARSHRMVTVVDREDGMADLIALLPAPYAYGIKDRLNQMAREVKLVEAEHATRAETTRASTGSFAGSSAGSWPGTTAGSTGRSAQVSTGGSISEPNRESTGGSPHASHAPSSMVPRSIDQIRADLLTDLLLAADPHAVASGGVTGTSSIQARVQVIVPEASVTLADAPRGTQPATLEGFGPIDTESARFYAANAPHWEQISVEPTSGSVISVDTYRPTAEQRRFLRARDLHCRFPGCRVALNRCDIDHTVDAARGGATSTDNLAHLCRGHHTLKHHSAWGVRQKPDGTLVWLSPTGRACTEPPPSRVRFQKIHVPAHGSSS